MEDKLLQTCSCGNQFIFWSEQEKTMCLCYQNSLIKIVSTKYQPPPTGMVLLCDIKDYNPNINDKLKLRGLPKSGSNLMVFDDYCPTPSSCSTILAPFTSNYEK